MFELTGSNHRCRAQFKCAQTVVGQRFAGNGPNGLSYTTTTTISEHRPINVVSQTGLNLGPFGFKITTKHTINK